MKHIIPTIKDNTYKHSVRIPSFAYQTNGLPLPSEIKFKLPERFIELETKYYSILSDSIFYCMIDNVFFFTMEERDLIHKSYYRGSAWLLIKAPAANTIAKLKLIQD